MVILTKRGKGGFLFSFFLSGGDGGVCRNVKERIPTEARRGGVEEIIHSTDSRTHARGWVGLIG